MDEETRTVSSMDWDWTTLAASTAMVLIIDHWQAGSALQSAHGQGFRAVYNRPVGPVRARTFGVSSHD
jgi:hypothetical protein